MILTTTVVCLFLGAGCSQMVTGSETTKQRDERMKWWREARFGILIQWGLYSIPAGIWKGERIESYGEWIMNKAPITVAEYEPLAKQFKPEHFSAERWVRIAKLTGAKYIVFSTKHHDGFSMFDSKLTDYDVVDATPFKRNVFKELAEQCKKQGLKMCAYYSIMDWHHPDYLPRQKKDTRSAETADFERYVKYMKGQLKELVTNYKPALLWFDGEWEKTWNPERGWDLYDYLRSLKSDLIINNRIGKGRKGMEGLDRKGSFAGDFGTPEQQIPATGLPGVDWETCMPMSSTWAYKSYVHDWKSSKVLIRNLVDIASKGGNYLLNVGPTAEGLIPEASVDRLNAIGKWMAVNGESIYGTTANPIGEVPWGRCTAKGNKLYMHIFDWPKYCQLVVPVAKEKIKKAYLLAEKRQTPLMIIEVEGTTLVRVLTKPLDEIDTVVVLEMKGVI